MLVVVVVTTVVLVMMSVAQAALCYDIIAVVLFSYDECKC
jgi:hypothetical protein